MGGEAGHRPQRASGKLSSTGSAGSPRKGPGAPKTHGIVSHPQVSCVSARGLAFPRLRGPIHTTDSQFPPGPDPIAPLHRQQCHSLAFLSSPDSSMCSHSNLLKPRLDQVLGSQLPGGSIPLSMAFKAICLCPCLGCPQERRKGVFPRVAVVVLSLDPMWASQCSELLGCAQLSLSWVCMREVIRRLCGRVQ